MSWFSNIMDSVYAKVAAKKESKDFQVLVDRETLPVRRKAYLEQKKRIAVDEGRMLAKRDSEKTYNQNQKKTEDDFGIMKGLSDPYKFLNKSMGVKK